MYHLVEPIRLVGAITTVPFFCEDLLQNKQTHITDLNRI